MQAEPGQSEDFASVVLSHARDVTKMRLQQSCLSQCPCTVSRLPRKCLRPRSPDHDSSILVRLRTVSEPFPDRLRAVSESSPSHLRAVSEPSPNRLRAASEPSPSRLRTVSEPSLSHLRAVFEPSPSRLRAVSEPSSSDHCMTTLIVLSVSARLPLRR